jgi:PAS domain-containing protein
VAHPRRAGCCGRAGQPARCLRNFPCTIGTRDGLRRHCLLNASTIVIENQTCLIAIVRDVSEQKAADDALQESQAKFSRIFASAPVAMSVTRLADRTHVDANPAWENLFGLERQRRPDPQHR